MKVTKQRKTSRRGPEPRSQRATATPRPSPGPPVAPIAGLECLSFATLTEVKARLSEHVRDLRPHERRLVITVGGKPAAVLIAYDEFVPPPRAAPTPTPNQRVLDLETWRHERPARERVRDSILTLFDPPALSRKGQKGYKRERVRAARP